MNILVVDDSAVSLNYFSDMLRDVGIYVRKAESPDRPNAFTVKGILGEIGGLLPLTTLDLKKSLGQKMKLILH